MFLPLRNNLKTERGGPAIYYDSNTKEMGTCIYNTPSLPWNKWTEFLGSEFQEKVLEFKTLKIKHCFQFS